MSFSPNIKLVVAAHKPFWMPVDSMYVPVQVGSVERETVFDWCRDDTGQSISEKNPRYSELTALYWAWKNLDADFVGLTHYRRHFKGHGDRNTLSIEDAQKLVEESPVILPSKRKYYIETVESHYSHTFDSSHLDVLREVLKEVSPDVLPAFEEHMNSRDAHIWNMMIMRKDLLDQWCSWLFPILAQSEERIDFNDMTPFEERVIGRLSERLLDPWIKANQIPFLENPVISMEKTNWINKGGHFLAAKFFGKKYGESF